MLSWAHAIYHRLISLSFWLYFLCVIYLITALQITISLEPAQFGIPRFLMFFIVLLFTILFLPIYFLSFYGFEVISGDRIDYFIIILSFLLYGLFLNSLMIIRTRSKTGPLLVGIWIIFFLIAAAGCIRAAVSGYA